MKLSFSLPSSKSSSKPNSIKPSGHKQDEEDDKSKNLITEFDASQPTNNSSNRTAIPPIQNEWKPHKKMKNLYLPITDPNNSESVAFEQDTSSVEPGSDMSYGLNLRHDKKPDDEKDNGMAQRPRPVPLDVVMLQKLKDDLQKCPDDEGFDEFKDVPVEGFGASVLAGYGWSEGMGIGRNAKEDVKVVLYKRRAGMEGLGFVGDAPASIRDNKKGKSEHKNDEIGTKEKVFRIIRGRDAGLKATVVSSIGDDWLVLELSKGGEQVKVKREDVAELGSAEEVRCMKKLSDKDKESKSMLGWDEGRKEEKRVSDKDKGSKSMLGRDEGRKEEKRVSDKDKGSKSMLGRDEGRKEERRVSDKDKGSKSMPGRDEGRKEEKRLDVNGDRKLSWLTSHIRVRVISRDFKGGRLYLKKGEVLDVVGPTTCDISMDESREIIQGVSQDLLETAIPRRGGPVLVLFGKHKGAYGSLVERDLDREMGVVRDADTHELLQVKLEQIAEYIGDPSLLGY